MEDVVRGFAYISETKETFAVSRLGPFIYKIDVSIGKLTKIADFVDQFFGKFTGITRAPNDTKWFFFTN